MANLLLTEIPGVKITAAQQDGGRGPEVTLEEDWKELTHIYGREALLKLRAAVDFALNDDKE